ncbi:MAG: IclR family transcriptional regulator [Lachnospiraceae bacterium]
MSEQAGLLEKGLSILELLAQTEDPMGPTEISQILGYNKATTYRILKTLGDFGYATHTSNGKYQCGAKLIEVASTYINNLELQTVAKPYLTALAAQLSLSVHLGVLDGSNTVYVEKLETKPYGASYTHVGYKSPAHCSSIGKCLLSSFSSIELDDLMKNWTFTKYTKNTITKPEKFKKHLKEVRIKGWSMDHEEFMIGHCCVGAPIFDYRGDAIACVSVSGETQQFAEESLPMIIELVMATGLEISEAMGYPKNRD